MMTTAHADPGESSAGGDRYGYGLALAFDGERLVRIGHGGGMVGYSAEMQADLESGYGIVAMTTGRIDQDGLAEFALKVLAAAAADRDLPPLPKRAERMSVEDAADYAGEYHAPGSRLSIDADGDRLHLPGWQQRSTRTT
jgi:hypothetical protein